MSKLPMTAREALEQMIREAVARGWCDPANAYKEMDTILAESIVREVLAASLPQEPEAGAVAEQWDAETEILLSAVPDIPQTGAAKWIEEAAYLLRNRRYATTIPARAQPAEPPRCWKCGYTRADCDLHMDHHLCGEPTPAAPKPGNEEKST